MCLNHLIAFKSFSLDSLGLLSLLIAGTGGGVALVDSGVDEVRLEGHILRAAVQVAVAERDRDDCLKNQLCRPVNALAWAKDDTAEERLANEGAEHDSLHRSERGRLVENLVLAGAHPSLLDDQADVRAGDCRGKVEADEIFGLWVVVGNDAELGTVLLDLLVPRLGLRVNIIAKEEVENGDSVDGVKDKRSLVEDEFAPGLLVCLRNEPDQVVVHHVAEEEVEAHTQDPT